MYRWFTMMCNFQVDSKVIQLYIHIHSFLKYSFPSWFLIGYWISFSVFINFNLCNCFFIKRWVQLPRISSGQPLSLSVKWCSFISELMDHCLEFVFRSKLSGRPLTRVRDSALLWLCQQRSVWSFWWSCMDVRVGP